MRKSTKTKRSKSAEGPAVPVEAPDALVLETPPAVEPEVEVAAAMATTVPADADELEKLTEKEAVELAKQEAVVKEHAENFWPMVAALKAIHDGKLYRATHKTFRDYCLDRWGFDRAHGSRVINASAVYENLRCLQGGDIPLPTTEAQVRPLTRVSPDKQEEVWREAVEKANGSAVTMKLVEEVATPHYPEKAKKAKADNAGAVVEPAVEKPEDETRRLLDRLDELLRGHENENVVEAFTRLKELLVCGDAGEIENRLAA